jgi:hypothetical protein
MNSDNEIMMEVLKEDEAEATAHLHRWNIGFAFLMQIRSTPGWLALRLLRG